MGSPDKKLLGIVKFWGPRKTESTNVSRDFWMPDQSCRVCYECDCQFTVFNRRHHCRLCGRVFCAKCTAQSIPIPSDEPKSDRDEVERLRVCNYCFKQWEQGLVTVNHEVGSASSPPLSPSPSAASLGSINSSFTGNSSTSTVGSNSMAYSTGTYEHVTYDSSASVEQSSLTVHDSQDNSVTDPNSLNTYVDVGDISSNSNQQELCENSRSDDDENACGEYYGAADFTEIDHLYGSCKGDLDGEGNHREEFGPLSQDNFSSEHLGGIKPSPNESSPRNNIDESEASLYEIETADVENLDFENNGPLWIPPEPEDIDDDREADFFDDEDDGDAAGEWGYQSSSSSLPSGDLPQREKSIEEHRKAMRNVVGGHFRALITQLLQAENIAVSEEYDKESWLDIITSLSWEAASLLKPDMSRGSGMDPGGYVKVKCLPCGRRSDSMVVKGVVCKKNVAHRRMTSKIDRPRLLILEGALEYQRVSNHLSSFDTLLQQEMDHLKMAVAKIDAHHPNILLVEKSVSRFAQEYLLAKSISLVLNIKRPLLERIARCSGAQIVPSIDHLKSPKLGYCESFHVEKYFEEHGSAGQGGKKLTKTLMFFEGCPRPLGFTILLKGASGDELKKVKHVVQYGVFAAYHLALETSYLADEGASLPKHPLKSPITVALPDKPLSINRSISTVPDLVTPTSDKPQSENSDLPSQLTTLPRPESSQSIAPTKSTQDILNLVQSDLTVSVPPLLSPAPNSIGNNSSQDNVPQIVSETSQIPDIYSGKPDDIMLDNITASSSVSTTGVSSCMSNHDSCASVGHNPMVEQNFEELNDKVLALKEDFPPPTSDGQSILVSLTTRCVWKGVVCERAHLFRIKYYRSFDKPLGRFLQDDLFDQSYRCRSCEMPSEAHIHCYTHQQGSLLISVRKLAEFLLPGEREGKIWMWHRCLRCPRVDGFPPATKRVAMSDAAWGLSFGKFLELSFSNHAAASRVASCGHSLHKDCLRFYGCGRMVACFRYAPIIVHSVFLPPSKLEFAWGNQEWIQIEANEVSNQGELLFTEVRNAINQISEKFLRSGASESNPGACGLRKHIVELERILEEEKEEFEESLQKAFQMEPKGWIDILDINKLRRRLVFQSYIWDQRLIYSSTLDASKLQQEFENLVPKFMEEHSKVVRKTDTRVGNDSDESSHHRSSSGEKSSDDDFLCKNDGDVSQHGSNVGDAGPVDSESALRRNFSTGQFPVSESLTDTLDAAWIGEGHSGKANDGMESASLVRSVTVSPNSGKGDRNEADIRRASSFALPPKGSDSLDSSTNWLKVPFVNIYQPIGKNTSLNVLKLGAVENYTPLFVHSLRELDRLRGARLLLPVGVSDTVLPVYDDEPTSVIAYALASPEYQNQVSDDSELKRDGLESSFSLPHFSSANFLPLFSPSEIVSGSLKSFGSSEEGLLSMSGSRGSVNLDPIFYTKALHAKVSFTDNGPLGKVKYSVTCYYAKRFEALRNMCCPSELDFIRSLSRCKKWGAQGGKSNVFFAKTLDDRFIIKQVTKTELESFIKFAPNYFKYLSESISTGSPTCLAKILGIYQVTSKHFKGGKESKMDVLVMENLLFRRNVTRLYDLKGSCRSRYNPDSSGGNKVLLDQNLIETMPTSPIFVGNKAKRLLERAVWNDTSFLASIDVMDYSLLVGVDEENHELVVGIIDFMRQYTWDKHLETWVKTSGILGGPKNAPPTVISPDQYKKRFRKAMTTYFLMVPDQWSPPTIIPCEPLSDNNDDNSRNVSSP